MKKLRWQFPLSEHSQIHLIRERKQLAKISEQFNIGIWGETSIIGGIKYKIKNDLHKV